MIGVAAATLGTIFIVFEYRIFLVNYVIENFLLERKVTTEGNVNEFYVGMSRSSLIAALKSRTPSSVTPVPRQTFNITDSDSDEWAKVDQNSGLGVMTHQATNL